MNTPNQLTLAEQRERLVLVCELDRLNLRLAMRPTPMESVALNVLERVAPFVPHIPGKLGKWARRIMRGTNVARGVYEAMFT
jgi:hypothetical protein